MFLLIWDLGALGNELRAVCVNAVGLDVNSFNSKVKSGLMQG